VRACARLPTHRYYEEHESRGRPTDTRVPDEVKQFSFFYHACAWRRL
jgi:hypothetical protein